MFNQRVYSNRDSTSLNFSVFLIGQSKQQIGGWEIVKQGQQ